MIGFLRWFRRLRQGTLQSELRQVLPNGCFALSVACAGSQRRPLTMVFDRPCDSERVLVETQIRCPSDASVARWTLQDSQILIHGVQYGSSAMASVVSGAVDKETLQGL